MRQVLLAGEEAQEGAALQRPVLADGSAQHGIALLDGIEDGTRGDRAGNVDLKIACDARQVTEVKRKYDANFAHYGFSFLVSRFSFSFSRENLFAFSGLVLCELCG
jgi:hypothetical protein